MAWHRALLRHADPITPLTLGGVQRRIGSLQEGILAASRACVATPTLIVRVPPGMGSLPANG